MNQTETHGLSQWEAQDRILREDFNADNAKTEQALVDLAEQTALISKCGNCKIVSTTYVGAGTYGADNPNHLTFDAPPLLVLVYGSSGNYFLMHQSCSEAKIDSGSVAYTISVSWNGNKVSWYSERNASMQLNSSGQTYYATAFFALT